MRLRTVIALTGAAKAAALAVYLRRIRPSHLRWGATDAEVSGPMPLDDRVADASMISTRAITVDATPEHIWPWIVQMGDRPRAGYYSYAWVERMQGMRIENAERILPEYQSLQVGDTIDRNGTIAVQYVEPGLALVLGPPEAVEGLRCTWAFALFPIDSRHTRLVTRVRAKFSYLKLLRTSPPYTWPFLLSMDPGVFVMERKMLQELKRRAESHDRTEEPRRERSGCAAEPLR